VLRKKEVLFLKKRTKKLLSGWRPTPERGSLNREKSFASFLQKRSAFFFTLALSPAVS
jgi:hypothetical protein